VVVVIHQYITVNQPAESDYNIVKNIKKRASIISITENDLTVTAFTRDVVNRSGKFYAYRSRHKL
jgi:hypothetical protein